MNNKINIDLNRLKENIKDSFTNMNEGMEQSKRIVTEALLEAQMEEEKNWLKKVWLWSKPILSGMLCGFLGGIIGYLIAKSLGL